MVSFTDATWGDEGIWIAGEYPKNFEAEEAVYAGQIVTMGTSGVKPASASDVPIGVAIQTVSAGKMVAVAIDGSIAYVLADGSGITAGHLVGATTVDSVDGYATDLGTTAPSGLSAHPVGIALETISANSTGKILLK